MRKSFADKLVCPVDKHELDLKVITTDIEENIIEGIFTCQQCKRYYPVMYGLPIMSPDEYRQYKLEAPVLNRWEKELNIRLSDRFLIE